MSRKSKLDYDKIRQELEDSGACDFDLDIQDRVLTIDSIYAKPITRAIAKKYKLYLDVIDDEGDFEDL